MATLPRKCRPLNSAFGQAQRSLYGRSTVAHGCPLAAVWQVFNVFWSGPALGSSAFDEIGHSMPAALKKLLQRLHATMQGGVGLPTDEGSQEAMAEIRRTAASIALDRLRAPLESQELMALKETVVGMESLRTLGEMLQQQAARLRETLEASGQRQLDVFLEETVKQVMMIMTS